MQFNLFELYTMNAVKYNSVKIFVLQIRHCWNLGSIEEELEKYDMNKRSCSSIFASSVVPYAFQHLLIIQ